MSEYIKREDATDAFSQMYPSATKSFILDRLAEIPAADVEPVVRGEWREFDADMNAYVCSVCDEPYVLIDGTPEQNHYNYCPNCGAHMMERSGSGE